ncbi:MAG: SURF1 family protein [Litoreibacter sp.]|nr:SURF1 family protein [Litoreibacter sp.]
MMRRLIFPILLGGVGCAILVSLGNWQMQRLEWKEAILASIEARMTQIPVELPLTPDPARDTYLSVKADGRILPEELQVLVSIKQKGAGYRIISVFETQGRRILLDRGFIGLEGKEADRPTVEASVIGNLHWPDEVDSYTPEPDLERNIWFARDVPRLAKELDTEPVLIVLRQTSETNPMVTPVPVDGAGIPNDHLQYAITWFSLAALWFGMTAYLVWRIRQRTV